jgi:hypothetical protein
LWDEKRDANSKIVSAVRSEKGSVGVNNDVKGFHGKAGMKVQWPAA